MDKQRKLRLATVTAMFAALIIITTAYIKIPAPLGYIHIGDSMVYLSAAILPGPFGFFAAAIGGAMADLLAGYPHWAIPTAIIKALNVLPFFLIKLLMTDRKKLEKIIHLQNLLMLIPTTLVTLGGYFVANALIQENEGSVRVLDCHETWHGITYREDMPDVVNYIASLREQGVYPETLLD